MSVLLIVRKNILKTTFSLIFVNKKLFFHNLSLLSLSNIEKINITIFLVSKIVPSIFKTLTLVFYILRPN